MDPEPSRTSLIGQGSGKWLGGAGWVPSPGVSYAFLVYPLAICELMRVLSCLSWTLEGTLALQKTFSILPHIPSSTLPTTHELEFNPSCSVPLLTLYTTMLCLASFGSTHPL